MKKSVLKTFAKFTRKHLCQSLFLIKLQAATATLLKQGLRHTPVTLSKKRPRQRCFKISFFYRTPPVTASEKMDD